MPESVEPTHESLLRLCAEASPKPWHPRVYAQTSGVDRNSLDVPLNDLRLAGFIQLTEWEPGIGQGYLLTDLGKEVLQNPSVMEQFKATLLSPVSQSADLQDSVRVPAVPTTFQRGELARKSYFEPEPPRVMPFLLLLNLIAFAMSFVVAVRMDKPLNEFIFNGDPTVLHAVGALSAPDLLHNEWWRLLTCCFLHFGLLHLGVNMYSLYVLGSLESIWGGLRFLIIYLFSGLAGSCAAMMFNPGAQNATLILAGASGAIWGVMLALFGWVWLNRNHLPPDEVSAKIRQYGFIVLLNLLVSTLPHISAYAHIGGGLVGLLTGSLLHYQRFSVPPRRTGITLMILLIPILCFQALTEVMEKSSKWKPLIEFEERQQQKQSQDWFRENAVAAVDKATVKLTVLQPLVELTTVPREKGESHKIARLELADELKKLTDLAVSAQKQLENDAPLPRREDELRLVGKTYMSALIDFSERAQDWLKLERNLNDPERAEQQKVFRKLDGAKAEWSQRKLKL